MSDISHGDITFLALGCAFLVLFFFYGIEKLYASILGSLIGVCLFFLMNVFLEFISIQSELTIVSRVFALIPEVQAFSLVLIIVLLILTPVTSSIIVPSDHDHIVWRISTVLMGTIFYLLYFLAIIGIVIYGPGPFAHENFFSGLRDAQWWNMFIRESRIFTFALTNAYGILLLGGGIIVLKILFGRFVDRILSGATAGFLTTKTMFGRLFRRGSKSASPDEGGGDMNR